MNKKTFTFIDLFAGIGGFHQALKSLGGECVFASEIDEAALKTYKENYGIDANHDITTTVAEDIPKHDILCGGFPCQAFSKAGKQNGLNDTRGTLFFEIERILKHHKTKTIILENVRNLTSHDHGRTWKIIQENLKALGYRLTAKPLLLSPHEFGIPHLRERVFIVGILDPKNVDKPIELSFENIVKKADNSVYSIINKKDKIDPKYFITPYEEMVLNAWNEFYQGIKEKVIGFPIWSEYFRDELIIPYTIPKWKADFIRRNRDLYNNNKEFIDSWLNKYNYLVDFVPTHRKFEWQAGKSIKSIWDGVIQFRPSGVRVKKPDVFPALVAMVHIPIIGKFKRRLTPRECARLQSFPESFKINPIDQQAYKQFGNSLNVEIARQVTSILMKKTDN